MLGHLRLCLHLGRAEDELLHLFEVVVLAVAEAGRTVALVADNARIAVFEASDDDLAAPALDGRRLSILDDHWLAALSEVPELLHAAWFRALSEPFALSAV